MLLQLPNFCLYPEEVPQTAQPDCSVWQLNTGKWCQGSIWTCTVPLWRPSKERVSSMVDWHGLGHSLPFGSGMQVSSGEKPVFLGAKNPTCLPTYNAWGSDFLPSPPRYTYVHFLLKKNGDPSVARTFPLAGVALVLLKSWTLCSPRRSRESDRHMRLLKRVDFLLRGFSICIYKFYS